MKRFLLMILIQIGFSCAVFSQSIRDTVSMHYVPYGLVKLDAVIKNGISYKYHTDNNSGRCYISTGDINFTNSDISIGSEFDKIKHLANIKKYKGWGYYLELPTGWNAYLCMDKSKIDSSKVLLFFSTQKKVFDSIIKK